MSTLACPCARTFLNRLCVLSYILFFTGGLWAWMLYFGLLFYGGWVVRALLILCAPCALALAGLCAERVEERRAARTGTWHSLSPDLGSTGGAQRTRAPFRACSGGAPTDRSGHDTHEPALLSTTLGAHGRPVAACPREPRRAWRPVCHAEADALHGGERCIVVAYLARGRPGSACEFNFAGRRSSGRARRAGCPTGGSARSTAR